MQDRYTGNDHYGRPKANYLAEISAMDNEAFYRECYSMIYHAARCSNNPRADWHWMVDACYDEARTRDEKAAIYCKAFDRCYAEHAG